MCQVGTVRDLTWPRPHPNASSDSQSMEYKYVVRNEDRSVAWWMPGPNCRLEVSGGAASPRLLRVLDAWDSERQFVQARWLGGGGR